MKYCWHARNFVRRETCGMESYLSIYNFKCVDWTLLRDSKEEKETRSNETKRDLGSLEMKF